MLKKNVLNNKKIGFIGAGNMATAIIEGLLASKTVKNSQIYISDKDNRKKSQKKKSLKVKTAKDNVELVTVCDIIILAVKPQNIEDVLNEIKDHLGAKKLIISIAAGVSTAYLRKFIPRKVNVVRVMPNVGSQVQESMTALSFKDNVSPHVKKIVESIFLAVGEVEKIKEKDMDVVTALSGSGPAYMAYIWDSFIKEAQRQGLDKRKAYILAMQMTKASIILLKETNVELDSLIKMVASKGGTTEAALKVFKEKKLNEILAEGLKAATKRSKELTKR